MIAACAATDPAFRAALASAGLPTDDLDDGPAHFLSLSVDGCALAYGGVAGAGADRLLRSVVVPPAGRRSGLGARIVGHLAEWARADGALRLWLLTTDAADYFARLGWEPVPRDDAPRAIAASRQFASVCPQSATLMVRHLAP